jgi:hypothetical protein
MILKNAFAGDVRHKNNYNSENAVNLKRKFVLAEINFQAIFTETLIINFSYQFIRSKK